MRTRSLPILLNRDEYRRLDEIAREQDRDPAQQARFIVRQALRDGTTPVEDAPPAQSNREAAPS